MSAKSIFVLSLIFFSNNLFAHSVFVEDLKKKCALSLESLSNDVDAEFAQKLIITKPQEAEPMRLRLQVELMINAQSIQAKAYEADEFFKVESGKIIRRSVKSGKSSARALNLLQLTQLVTKKYSQANRIDVAIEDQTGHIYSLEVYGRHEFILRNLTTNKIYSFKSTELDKPVNVFFSKNRNESFLNIQYTDSWNIVITGMGQPLFNLDFSLVHE
ncbi:MAG: hypothetical protein IPM57_06785 [Oligoflexia bacterium]|nr:hypothetical protein [Oligoflexia bacterium]